MESFPEKAINQQDIVTDRGEDRIHSYDLFFVVQTRSDYDQNFRNGELRSGLFESSEIEPHKKPRIQKPLY
jgi:hypothetical protein